MNDSTSSQSRACGSGCCQPLEVVYLKSFHPPFYTNNTTNPTLELTRSSSFLDNMEGIVRTIDSREEEQNKISDKIEGSEELRAEELAAKTYV